MGLSLWSDSFFFDIKANAIKLGGVTQWNTYSVVAEWSADEIRETFKLAKRSSRTVESKAA